MTTKLKQLRPDAPFCRTLLRPLAVLLAAAAAPLAQADDISVPAGETLTISSTPAVQPGVADIHGSLTVSDGATVFPTTINVGCAAGDAARVTVTGSGTRFGDGRSENATASSVTVGAGGGSGMMEVDGGDANVDGGGLGLGSLTIAADAVSSGDTIDFLTLKTGYARTSGMVNANAKPARILFAGGGLRCGQPWGTKLTESGDFVWESVNKSTILVDLSNYGNGVTIGETGSLTIRGAGTVNLRCAWGDGGTGNGQVTVVKAIAWEGSNSLYLGDNLKLNLQCDDALPYGVGKGSVTINSGNAYVNNKYSHTQHVNSLYVKSGRYCGTGRLVFGAEDVDGELSGRLADEVQLEKVGAGTLTIAGTTAATVSAFTVKAGTVLVKNAFGLRKFVIEDGARIVVDGAELTVSEASDCSKVECRNGGRVVLSAANAAESALVKLDLGGETEFRKSGLGKLMVYDPSALPCRIAVAEGEVAFSRYGCTNTFYRWTVRATSHPDKAMKIGELGLFDGNGTWFDWPSPESVGSIGAMGRGCYYIQGGLTYGWFTQGFQYALDHVLTTGGRNVWVEFAGSIPVEGDSSTWRVIGWRLPEGVDSLSAFDVCVAPDFDWKPSVPTAWLLESSADGVNWTTVHELATGDDHGSVDHGCWLGGGQFKDGVNTPPKQHFLLRNYMTLGLTSGRETFAAELGKDAQLDVSAFDAGAALNALTLSAEGGMALTGAKFAPAGTLTISGAESGALPREMEIACQFAACEGVESLCDWQVAFDGAKRRYIAEYDPANGKLKLTRRFMAVILK